jgi:ABC-type nitrate/sulfonate/bicarbonate transport system substrate-binding protein
MRIARLGVLLLAGASVLASGLSATAQQLREITFGLPSKSIVASPPRMAEELGLFARHGLQPKFSYIDSTAGTASALLSRSVDFAVTGISEVIAANSRGQSLLVVSNHYNGLAGSIILSKSVADRTGIRPDAPVADRLKALNNVLLASTSKISSLTIATKGAANAAGAEPRYAYMAVGAMGAALESGAVEGAVVTAPFWAIQVLKGSAVLWISPARGDLAREHMPTTASITAASRATVDANPDVARKVAAVFDDLAAAFTERPAEVKAAIARLYPELDAATLDLVLSLEARAYAAKILTPADVLHDIAHMKLSGMDLGPIDRVDPASVLLKR